MTFNHPLFVRIRKHAYILVAILGGVVPCLWLSPIWLMGLWFGFLLLIMEPSFNILPILTYGLSWGFWFIFFIHITILYYKNAPWKRINYVFGFLGALGGIFSLTDTGFAYNSSYVAILIVILCSSIITFCMRHKTIKPVQPSVNS